uniref:Uncharacterized protein n=1 Tax=Leersia perrieri TaxID=77586 RepID=A0A0D9WXX2_9ORYZ
MSSSPTSRHMTASLWSCIYRSKEYTQYWCSGMLFSLAQISTTADPSLSLTQIASPYLIPAAAEDAGLPFRFGGDLWFLKLKFCRVVKLKFNPDTSSRIQLCTVSID